MRGIVDWLENLGLSQYAQRFVDNDIDLILLSELTDGDLKELGVVSLGHRRKLLRAITAMGTPSAVTHAPRTATPVIPQPIAGVASRSAAIPARVETLGQRRHVTVLFCDVADSTAIAAKLDAEEWRDLVEGFRETASAAVTEMGGHVAQKLGDGLMSLFGYPLAHENDAERAARAALAIQRALDELNRTNAAAGKPVLNARIGLETGPVVLNAAGEIFGDAPNIAARVQALADPGTILITAAKQRHQPVAQFLRDMAAHFGNCGRRRLSKAFNQVAPFFGVELRWPRDTTPSSFRSPSVSSESKIRSMSLSTNR
jgi:class 3 adenylate cyclase